MDDVDLHLEPNEASDLCPVFDAATLERRGWDRAFVTVLDEASAHDAVALIVHAAGAGDAEGWDAIRVHGAPSDTGATQDAEACATHGGFLYLLGSQFGKKAGPLQASRSWIARVGERQLADAAHATKKVEVDVEIARLRFGLHRAVNDALAAAGVDLIALGPAAREGFIDQTIRLGAEKGKRWSGRITSADHPINVEACEFRANGRLLLGLRYPVTAGGHPILVELDDAAALFDDPDAIPRCSHVWTLEGVGTEAAPTGVRALHATTADAFHAIVGDLDAADKGAAILADHPEGAVAPSRHVRFDLPLLAGGGPVAAATVHTLDDLHSVEGIAVDDTGRALYVIDRDGNVHLRTTVHAARA